MHYFNREIGLETYALWKLYLNERLNLEMPYYNQLYAIEANKYDYLINMDYTTDSHMEGNGTVDSTGNSVNTDNLTIQSNDSGEDKFKRDNSEEVSGTDNRTVNVNDNSSGNSKGNSTTINSDFPQATFNKGTDYASGSQQMEDEQNTGTSGHSDTTDNNSNSRNSVGSINDTTTYGKANKTTHVREANGETTENETSKNEETGNVKNYGTSGSKTALMLEYRNAIINIDQMVIEMLGDLFMTVY